MWGYVSLPRGPKIKESRPEMVASPLEPIPEDEAAPLTLSAGKTSGNSRSSYNKYDEENKAGAMALVVTEMLSNRGAYAAFSVTSATFVYLTLNYCMCVLQKRNFFPPLILTLKCLKLRYLFSIQLAETFRLVQSWTHAVEQRPRRELLNVELIW